MHMAAISNWFSTRLTHRVGWFQNIISRAVTPKTAASVRPCFFGEGTGEELQTKETPYQYIHLFTYSVVYFFHLSTYSLVHLFTRSLVHLLARPLVHLFICSLNHLFPYSLIHLFAGSLIHWCTCSLGDLFNCSLIHLVACSLIKLPFSFCAFCLILDELVGATLICQLLECRPVLKIVRIFQ